MMRLPTNAPDGYPFAEVLIRESIGLNKDEVRAIRKAHLRETDHFCHGKKNRVWLNQSGVAALRAAAQMPPEKIAALAPAQTERADEADKSLPPKNPPSEVTLRIVRNNVANRYLVLACPREEDPWRPKHIWRVNVSNRRTGDDMRANLVRGMEIPVRLVAAPDLYQLTRPMPRKKGQW